MFQSSITPIRIKFIEKKDMPKTLKKVKATKVVKTDKKAKKKK